MKYRVSGKQAVFGNAPGTEFEADIPEVQAARLVAGSALEVVSVNAAAPDQGKDGKDDNKE